jgi:salicylate hydroxylase
VLIDIDRSDTIERYGAPYYQIHRADLHSLLARRIAELDPRVLHTAARVERVEDSGSSVQLIFGSEGSAPLPAVQADAVIGADGWRSLLRASVFGVQPPEFSGYVAWRGLIPLERLSDPTLASGSRVSIGPARLFVHYPIRKGRLLNFVAFARTGQQALESWSLRGSVAEVAQTLHDFHDGVHRILAAVPDGVCNKWGLFAREPLPQWTRGRVALIGDAAHPMMPWFGQGAATAIEDGLVLARCLEASTTLDEAWRRYEQARLPRVTLVHRESLLGGERLAGARPDLMSPDTVRNEDTLGLFRYDPATVAV